MDLTDIPSPKEALLFGLYLGVCRAELRVLEADTLDQAKSNIRVLKDAVLYGDEYVASEGYTEAIPQETL